MNQRRVPVLVAVLAAVGFVGLTLPVVALLWRAPWSVLGPDLKSPELRTALLLSLQCSLLATLLAIVFGLPLAYVLARAQWPGRRVVRALALLPIVLPPVVGGVALLLALGRRGLVGRFLDDIGIQLPFTTAGAVLAETFVAMPFLVITAEAGFRRIDVSLEEAARTLGAGRWRVFRTVTVPLAAPSLIAGAVLCWARALGEFGATLTFAGNLPGKTQTVPLAVYGALESRPEGAVVLSIVLLAVSFAILVFLRDHWLGARN